VLLDAVHGGLAKADVQGIYDVRGPSVGQRGNDGGRGPCSGRSQSATGKGRRRHAGAGKRHGDGDRGRTPGRSPGGGYYIG